MRKFIFGFILSSIFVIHLGAQSVIMSDTRYIREPIEKIAVVTQILDDQLRGEVEDVILSSFAKKGIDAVNAYDMIQIDSTYFYSTLEREFTAAGVDGILIVKLVNIEISDMYIFPGDVLAPDAYNYYEFYSVYYYYDLPIISEPGYMSRIDRTFRIDINLYHNQGDMILMATQTKLLDPMNPEKVTKNIGKNMARILSKQKYIVRK